MGSFSYPPTSSFCTRCRVKTPVLFAQQSLLKQRIGHRQHLQGKPVPLESKKLCVIWIYPSKVSAWRIRCKESSGLSGSCWRKTLSVCATMCRLLLLASAPKRLSHSGKRNIQEELGFSNQVAKPAFTA